MTDEQQNPPPAPAAIKGNMPDEQGTGKNTAPGFLREADGKPSTMRLMSVIALLAGIWFGWMTLNSGAENQTGLYITTAFLIAAFAPKALQKFIENYYPINQRSKR